MDTVVIGLVAIVWLLLCGSSSFKALGAISVDVIMKKISSRNTRSLIDDDENSPLTLECRLSAIAV